MNRRNFIYSSSIISTAAMVDSKSTVHLLSSNPPAIGYYMVRSGNFKNDNFYLLGVFEVANPDSASEQIQAIKAAYNYKTKLSYNSNDKFKIPVAKDIIDFFVNSNIKVKALLDIPSSENDSRSDYQLKFDALGLVLGNGFQSNLIAKNESYYGPSTRTKENFNSTVGGELITQSAHQSLLLQMSDLINGCIYGAIHNQISNPTKLEIINYFKEKIDIQNFTKGTKKPNKLEII